MKTQISRLVLFITLAAVASMPFSPAPVVAQEPCDAIIGQFQRARDRCAQVNVDFACYAHSVVASSPTDFRFYQPGDRLHVTAMDNITTERLDGAVVMRVKSVFHASEVTLFLFGGADAVPQDGASNVFVLTVENNREICLNSPPGMMIHTKRGDVGRISVNGVQIDLASTAYVVMDNPDTMVIGNVAGQVTVIVPGEAQTLPVGYQTQATGISAGEPALSWPLVPSLYTTSAVAQWLAGLTGLEVVTDSNTEQPDPVPACGGTIAVGQTLTAQNAVPGQECIYSFCADAGMAVTVDVKSNTPGHDPYVDLLGSDFRPIAFNDNISRLNPNSLICNQTLPYTSCDYRLVVRPAQNRSAGQFTLSLLGKTSCTVPVEYCKVVARGLNLRPGPGLRYTPPLKVLAYGTLFDLLDRTLDATWVQVKVVGSGDIGWVSNSPRYISCDETKTPTPTKTTITPTHTPTPSDTPSNTPTPTDTPTYTPTPTDTPTHTPTPTPVKGSPFPGP